MTTLNVLLLTLNFTETSGKTVLLTHYVSNNLGHDITTGCSLIGVPRLLNGTPTDCVHLAIRQLCPAEHQAGGKCIY